MQYINHKKISYILSEEPGLSGKIAFEFLSEIVNSNDVLKFIFHGQGENGISIDSLLEIYDDIIIIMNRSNEKVFVIKNINIDNRLLELLCLLGKFPNYLVISRIDSNLNNSHISYYWSIEYSDEVLSFTYADKYFDGSKITIIEKKLETKGISYERKETKSFKIKSKNNF